MRAIILAGGMGTRLKPYTTILPKPLLPVEEFPILEIIVRQLRFYGFQEITFSVGYLAQLIQAYFGDGSKLGVNISYSYEDKPLGTAGPISIVNDLNDRFLLMNGDVLTNLNFREMFEWHINHGGISTVGIYEKELQLNLGLVNITEDDLVDGYDEKPILRHWVSMGIYIFEPEIKKHLKKNERIDLPELILQLINKNEKVRAYKFRDTWLDIGRPDDYQEAVTSFNQNRTFFLRDE